MNDPFEFPDTYVITIDGSDYTYHWFVACNNGSDSIAVYYNNPTPSLPAGANITTYRVYYDYLDFHWSLRQAGSVNSASCGSSTAVIGRSGQGDLPTHIPQSITPNLVLGGFIIISLFIYMLFKVFKR